MDLENKVQQLSTLGTDLGAVRDSLKQISASIQGARTAVADIGAMDLHIDKLDPKEALKSVEGKGAEVLDWLINHVPGAKDIMNWITGDADKLNSVIEAWSKTGPAALEAQKANLKKAAGDLDEAWKGKVATLVGKVTVAVGGPVLDAVEDVEKAVGNVFAFLAKILKQLHDFIIKTLVDLVAKIVQRLTSGAALAAVPGIGWIGEAVNFAYAMYQIYDTAQSFMDAFSKLNNDITTACTAVKNAMTAGQAAWHDFQALTADA